MKKVAIYDTTLRDGAQGEGIHFSLPAKIRLARNLDAFGVDYIEGGFAASNPADRAFFEEIRKEPLTHAKVAVFGSTRRARHTAQEDPGLAAILATEAPVATIFGKSWLLHVEKVLKTTPEENLGMIADSVRFLKANGKEVIYDAEHFFDGYKDNPGYALDTLRAAMEAGADWLCLCDTNGGGLPSEVFEITAAVREQFSSVRLGIHTHNDSELAVATSLSAVEAGATLVQGTLNGYGERTGNANLCSIIPCLALKMGISLTCGKRMKNLKSLSLLADELTDQHPLKSRPFVGESAFAHKAGMHVDAVSKVSTSFEHVDPSLVGNERRVLISELSGSSNVRLLTDKMGIPLQKDAPEVKDILCKLENLEKSGYQFESADASVKLLIQKTLKKHTPFFELEGFSVVVQKRDAASKATTVATIKVNVNGQTELTAGEGDGPVDALNNALRKVLLHSYPAIKDVVLEDYHVRILNPETATKATTRVLIDSSDRHARWGTVGVSENIIEASWEALVDSLEYKLLLDEQRKRPDAHAGADSSAN
ncbi:MAG: citramalate synthase [Verrucomicrobiota bacterium]|jgi:2-isopropylmalate synthase|nr:citramalate synthase [Verrucomicrobiota bacterium]